MIFIQFLFGFSHLPRAYLLFILFIYLLITYLFITYAQALIPNKPKTLIFSLFEIPPLFEVPPLFECMIFLGTGGKSLLWPEYECVQ